MRLKRLEDEKRKPKKLLAEPVFDNASLKELLSTMWRGLRRGGRRVGN